MVGSQHLCACWFAALRLFAARHNTQHTHILHERLPHAMGELRGAPLNRRSLWRACAFRASATAPPIALTPALLAAGR